MKKLIPLLLALTLLLSLGVTAFAEDISGSSGNTATGTQRIYTVTKPLTWIMEIPGECFIPFGTTTRIDAGDVKIKDVSWDNLENEHLILASVSYTGKLTSSSGEYLSYTLYGERHWGNGGTTDYRDNQLSTNYPDEVAIYRGKNDPGLNYDTTIYILIDSSEWVKNLAGGTYEETVTYTSRYKAAIDP